ncbi:hypothetical protein MSIM_54130 [Mycobacterium simiae]|nr:hypothetical protein MSIM_54130 [Mycobacterium simiae]
MTAMPAFVSADKKRLPAMSARMGAATVAAAVIKLAVNTTNPKALACPAAGTARWVREITVTTVATQCHVRGTAR